VTLTGGVGSPDVTFVATVELRLPTLAVFTSTPALLGTTTMVMVAVAPLARVPTVQLTGVVLEQEPCVEEDDVSVAVEAMASLTVIPFTGTAPLLVTAIVYVRG